MSIITVICLSSVCSNNFVKIQEVVDVIKVVESISRFISKYFGYIIFFEYWSWKRSFKFLFSCIIRSNWSKVNLWISSTINYILPIIGFLSDIIRYCEFASMFVQSCLINTNLWEYLMRLCTIRRYRSPRDLNHYLGVYLYPL